MAPPSGAAMMNDNAMTQARKLIPVSFFGMAVGSLAWGHAWRAAAGLWVMPDWLPQLAAVLGLALWLALMLAYARKWLAHSALAQQELGHPVMSAMAALVAVSTLLAAITLKAWLPQLAWGLFVLALLLLFVQGLWWVGRFWQGTSPAGSLLASAYLPGVAQNLVAATAAASFGHEALAALFFGAGVLSWLAMESLVMHAAAQSLPPPQRPLLGIQMAPPVVAGLAYVSIVPGPPDLLAKMLLGYGIYQGLLALRLLRWSGAGGFAPSHWAFSFGVMALSTLTLQFAQRSPDEPLWQILAPVFFVVANAVMALLLGRTLMLARQGRLLPS